MIFARKSEKTLIEKIQTLFWPRKGFMRIFKYLLYQIQRLRGTPYAIACGMAFGAAVSVTPLLGFHVLLAALLTFICRGSVVASFIGTFYGNPWTAPIIWVGTYKTGKLMLLETDFVAEKIKFSDILNSFILSVKELNVDLFIKEVYPVFWPMLVGSIVWGIITWIVVYFLTKKIVSDFQEKRRKKMIMRGHKINERHH